jgi:hypothetical protein
VAFGEDTFGLFQQDAAVQGSLELVDEGLVAAQGAFLDQADGGDVHHGLADLGDRAVQLTRVGVE